MAITTGHDINIADIGWWILKLCEPQDNNYITQINCSVDIFYFHFLLWLIDLQNNCEEFVYLLLLEWSFAVSTWNAK